MSGWKIGLLVTAGLGLIGAAVFGILKVKKHNDEIDQLLADAEEEAIRQKLEKELKANGFRVNDTHTPEEREEKIRDMFKELGFDEPEYYNLAFSRDGLLVEIDFL